MVNLLEKIDPKGFFVSKANIQIREELENRIRFETLISDISACFVKLSAGEMDRQIEQALTQIREFFDVDRCGFLSVCPGKPSARITHASYADGVEQVSKEIDMAGLFPWTYQQLVVKGQVAAFTRMTELPPEAEKDCRAWSAMDVKSRLAIPLFSGREVRYILTIQSLVKEREWPREFVPRLKLIGEIFVNALERREATRALRESEEHLNLAAEAAGIGLWIIDVHSHRVWVTPQLRELFCFTADEEINFESFFKVIHPEDQEAVRRSVEQALQTRENLRVDYRLVLPNGQIRWIGARGRSYLKPFGEPGRLMGVSIDITDRKGTEEKLLASQETLRAFTSRLLTIQEEERRRLARELHDDFTQRLAVLAMDLSSLEMSTRTAGTKYESRLKQIRDQIIKLSTDIHDISRQLHPSIIDDLGLGRAIQSECTNFTRRTGIRIDYKQSPIPPTIPRDISVSLFRITQEALRNIYKHAQVQEARVSLHGEGDRIQLRIQDQGTGFNPDDSRKTQGLGLFSMQERVQLIHGNWSIHSARGCGTEIRIIVPLNKE
jgi:PAS domain S-box-containing protein